MILGRTGARPAVSDCRKGAEMTRLQSAIDQIRFARWYTLRLLDATRPADWFQMPQGVSHIAWQVGHPAMAEYRLVLERVRGIRSSDEEIVPASFIQLFLRESVPRERSQYPEGAEIRRLFERVHEQVLLELPGVPESEWDMPVLTPHAFVKTKLEAVMWCGQHQLVHAGQIALLRRLLGYAPVW